MLLILYSAGPTVLEVFNTLLRQLRQSVDYQLTGYYDNGGKHKTSSIEEKKLQDAVIKTIGVFILVFKRFFALKVTNFSLYFSFYLLHLSWCYLMTFQDPLPTHCLFTRGQRSCCSSWGRFLFLVSTQPWVHPTPGTIHTNFLCSLLPVVNTVLT